MRTLIIILFGLLFIAPGCDSTYADTRSTTLTPIKSLLPETKTPPNPFIPGMYTTTEEGNFYTVWDTILIENLSNQPTRFRVSRHTAFHKNSDDSDPAITHDHKEWFGLYDEVSQALSGITRNIDVQCIPAQHQVRLLGIVYNRVE